MLLIGPLHNFSSNFHSFSSVLHILMLFMPFFIYFCLFEICYNFFKEIKGETEIVIWSAVIEEENWRTLSSSVKLNISTYEFSF